MMNKGKKKSDAEAAAASTSNTNRNQPALNTSGQFTPSTSRRSTPSGHGQQLSQQRRTPQSQQQRQTPQPQQRQQQDTQQQPWLQQQSFFPSQVWSTPYMQQFTPSSESIFPSTAWSSEQLPLDPHLPQPTLQHVYEQDIWSQQQLPTGYMPLQTSDSHLSQLMAQQLPENEPNACSLQQFPAHTLEQSSNLWQSTSQQFSQVFQPQTQQFYYRQPQLYRPYQPRYRYIQSSQQALNQFSKIQQIVQTPSPQHNLPQQPVSQPELTSHPSTSRQQVLDADNTQQTRTVNTVQDNDSVQASSSNASVASEVISTPAPSTLRLSEDFLQLFTQETKHNKISEKDLNIPSRRNPKKAGTIGIPICVATNMFEIIFKDNFVTTAIHYDVKIVPNDEITQQRKLLPKSGEPRPTREIKNKTLLRNIFEQWRSEHYPTRYPAYDGMANAFAACEFSFKDRWAGQVTMHDNDQNRDRTFNITITKAGIVDLSWMKTMTPGIADANMNQTAVQVLDIILRHAPASRLLSVGRSFFPPEQKGETISLQRGLDLHVGSFTSAIIGWKPYLNIDVAHKVFVSSLNVVDIILEICSPQRGHEWQINIDKVNKVLSGIKVYYEIPNQPSTKRMYRINGLGKNAYDYTFEKDGVSYTIYAYFTAFKHYKLSNPEYPCLWVGSRSRNTYLPPELCRIVPDQVFKRKPDELQTAAIIKFAATSARTRQLKIYNAVKDIKLNDSFVMQNEFHLEVSNKMRTVNARILPPPMLQYSDFPVKVNKGTWRVNKFNKPARLEDGTWVLVNMSGENIDGQIQQFAGKLRSQAHFLGMTIGQWTTIPRVSPEHSAIERCFFSIQGFKLIVVILPNRMDIYGTVKKISELRVGVLTQCIKAKNVRALNNSTIQNILLKINSKLNGINHTFTQNTMPSCLRNKRYMIIGADVSHPSPESKDIPSVAAVAASHDETTFKYNVTIRLQQPKQEEIADLEEIMIKHIKFYVNQMRVLPQVIIFYRDGVSEGQIGMVLEKEIKSIKDACREYAREQPAFNPKLTFVIVQKRHHVRIFPTRLEDSDDRNFNVKAGTIVDTEITHPSHIDFYLVSHASIQGTAKPTKYRCICNESNFNEDQLEELTYHLCHMYARCTRSVSYPVPTYYAHLAAYRGRMWIQGDRYTEMDLQDKNKCKLDPKLTMPMSFV